MLDKRKLTPRERDRLRVVFLFGDLSLSLSER